MQKDICSQQIQKIINIIKDIYKQTIDSENYEIKYFPKNESFEKFLDILGERKKFDYKAQIYLTILFYLYLSYSHKNSDVYEYLYFIQTMLYIKKENNFTLKDDLTLTININNLINLFLKKIYKLNDFSSLIYDSSIKEFQIFLKSKNIKKHQFKTLSPTVSVLIVILFYMHLMILNGFWCLFLIDDEKANKSFFLNEINPKKFDCINFLTPNQIKDNLKIIYDIKDILTEKKLNKKYKKTINHNLSTKNQNISKNIKNKILIDTSRKNNKIFKENQLNKTVDNSNNLKDINAIFNDFNINLNESKIHYPVDNKKINEIKNIVKKIYDYDCKKRRKEIFNFCPNNENFQLFLKDCEVKNIFKFRKKSLLYIIIMFYFYESFLIEDDFPNAYQVFMDIQHIMFYDKTIINKVCHVKLKEKNIILKNINDFIKKFNDLPKKEENHKKVKELLESVKTDEYNDFLSKNNIEKNLFLDIHPLFTLLSIILFYANLILFDDWSLIYIDENFNPYETFYGKYYFKYGESKICNHVFFETFFLEDQKIIEEISKKNEIDTNDIYTKNVFIENNNIKI